MKKPEKIELRFGKTFARFYDPFMAYFESRYLQHRRKRLLEPLRGEILEIGSGTGVNFSHYHPESRIFGVEPSEHMLRIARKRIDRERPDARIHINLSTAEDPALFQEIPENSLDAAVSTLVLCSVNDPAEVLGRIYRWLKPGGKLVVLEHIASRKKMERTMQNLVTPVWKHLAEGCHLNRPTDLWIREYPFEVLKENYFHLGFPFYEAVFQKKGN